MSSASSCLSSVPSANSRKNNLKSGLPRIPKTEVSWFFTPKLARNWQRFFPPPSSPARCPAAGRPPAQSSWLRQGAALTSLRSSLFAFCFQRRWSALWLFLSRHRRHEEMAPGNWRSLELCACKPKAVEPEGVRAEGARWTNLRALKC